MNADSFKNCKLVNVTPPAAIVNNGSLTTAEIDTKGFRHLRLIVILGATDIALTALKLTESDSTGSNHVDITGTVFGTATDIDGATSALPSATDDNKLWVIDVDLRGRKRFIDSTITVGNGSTGAYVCVLAELYRAEISPSTSAEMGAGDAIAI